MGPLEIATIALSRAQQRVETAAQNLSNMTTPGFKAHRLFASLLSDASAPEAAADTGASIDFSDGKLQNTGNAFDIALSGQGFFAVRSPTQTLYTRNGQFHPDADGRLVTADGLALQADAGDATVQGPGTKVLAGGTITDDGQPSGRVTVVTFDNLSKLKPVGGGLYEAPEGMAQTVGTPQIHQGMLESSNVTAADEMISIMGALRSAESGQRVVQAYDDLLGRALGAFGQV